MLAEKAERNVNSAGADVQTSPNIPLDYDKDPRPDLDATFQDHALWVALLTAVQCRGDRELFSILHALRCGGAQLIKDPDFGMLIRPGEWEEAEYKEYTAAHMIPRKADVVSVLKAAAKLLPQAERDTLNARVIARVRQVEPQLIALGWTKQEIWAEEEWRHPRYGRQMQSIYRSLLRASQTWGHCEIGEITAQYVEILVPGPGLSGPPARLREYKIPPEFRRPLLADPEEAKSGADSSVAAAQSSAPLKKGEASTQIAAPTLFQEARAS